LLDGVLAETSGNSWKVEGRVIQSRPYFSFPLTLALETDKQTIAKQIFISGKATSFELSSDRQPQRLTADPEYNLLRRLFPSEIPPAVNALKGSPSVITVLSENLDPEIKKAAELLTLSLGLKHNNFVDEIEVDRQMMAENDILVIGLARRADLFQNIPDRVTIRPDSFRLNETLYEKPSDAFFGVFEHPTNSDRMAALFMPLSPQYAELVARKITHYGKYSYLAFQSGKNLDKGIWPVEKSPLVYEWRRAP
jgi:hypothetical protein